MRVILGLQHCRDCPLKHQCLRRVNQTNGRQVSFALSDRKAALGFIEKMKHKIDSPMGRHIYSQRLGTVEPVFGNLESNRIAKVDPEGSVLPNSRNMAIKINKATK